MPFETHFHKFAFSSHKMLLHVNKKLKSIKGVPFMFENCHVSAHSSVTFFYLEHKRRYFVIEKNVLATNKFCLPLYGEKHLDRDMIHNVKKNKIKS